MSWQAWLEPLKIPDSDGNVWVDDTAICGYEPGQESVWASTGTFNNISAEEIKRIVHGGADLFREGPTVAGCRCQVIRDGLHKDERYMDLKTKRDDQGVSLAICVGRSQKALVIAKGINGAHSGKITIKVADLVEKLIKSNY